MINKESGVPLVCACCGHDAEGEYGIHRDGFCEGPEVPLCSACGENDAITCEEIWRRIAAHPEDVIPYDTPANRRRIASKPESVEMVGDPCADSEDPCPPPFCHHGEPDDTCHVCAMDRRFSAMRDELAETKKILTRVVSERDIAEARLASTGQWFRGAGLNAEADAVFEWISPNLPSAE